MAPLVAGSCSPLSPGNGPNAELAIGKWPGGCSQPPRPAPSTASVTSADARLIARSPGHVVEETEHVVDVFGRLGIELVSALGLDHVDHFVDHRDVGRLKITLIDRAEPVAAAFAGRRRTGGLRLDREVVADRLQTRRIDETGELDEADLRRRRLTLKLDA